jgi:glycerate kinase
MRIVVAPDKFKGTLTALQAARAMAAGVAQAAPAAEVRLLPVADGGEGTAAAFLAAGAREVHTTVSGPLGDPVNASWAQKGHVAVIESAQANVLVLVVATPATSLSATTFGVGELVRAALDAGCTEIVLAVGGSATTDAGVGMAQALGVVVADAAGAPLPLGGGSLLGLASIDPTTLDPRLRTTAVTVACDVDNPLTGASGAAAVYGRQKGAGPAELEILERGLRRFAEVAATLPKATLPGGKQLAGLAAVPGGGAAGGLAAGAIAFLGGRLTSGAELVLGLIGADDAMTGADLVLTGEGSLDGQSLHGKAPGAVAEHARAAGAAVIAVTGVVDISDDELAAAGIMRAFSLLEIAADAADARDRAAELLTVRPASAVAWWLDHHATRST